MTMTTQLTAHDASNSMQAHVAAMGVELHGRYGPTIGWRELVQILSDPSFVRYPCEIVFDSKELLPGEFAHPVCNGKRPEEGFRMFVHPFFMTQLDKVPYLVLYQLVLVNYGEFAAAEDAEVFGAAALGLSRDDYYAALCELADAVN